MPSDHDLYPLSEFCDRDGRELSSFRLIAAADVPEPYQRLLVHTRDMTGVLEEFHGQPIHLENVEARRGSDRVLRRVVLTLEDGRPVEFGAIDIALAPFPEEAQEVILACHTPLGAILHLHGVDYVSRTRGFFEIDSSALIAEALQIEGNTRLYGRMNDLFAPAGDALAQVVEILPPTG